MIVTSLGARNSDENLQCSQGEMSMNPVTPEINGEDGIRIMESGLMMRSCQEETMFKALSLPHHLIHNFNSFANADAVLQDYQFLKVGEDKTCPRARKRCRIEITRGIQEGDDEAGAFGLSLSLPLQRPSNASSTSDISEAISSSPNLNPGSSFSEGHNLNLDLSISLCGT